MLKSWGFRGDYIA